MSSRSKSRTVNKKEKSKSRNKFVTKKIKVNTPYLADGVITKKYINLEYLKEQAAKRELEKDEVQARRYRDDYEPHFAKPDKSPYELALSQSPKRKNKYEHVKSKYKQDQLSMTSMKQMTPLASYVYDIGVGNNSPIICRIMKRRIWWKSIQETFRPPCFFWRMYLKEFKFDILAPNQPQVYTLNRLERHGQIGSKDNLYRNLWFHCQKTQQDINQIVPLTFSFRIGEKEFEEDLQEFAKFFRAIGESAELEAIKPIDSEGKSYFDFELGSMASGNDALTNNTGRKFKNPDPAAIARNDAVFFSGKNLWILKPSGLNRGKGLELFSRLDELREFLKLYMSGYDVKEFAAMSYDDTHNVSPSFVKYMNTSQQGIGGSSVAPRPSHKEPQQNKATFPSFVIQKYMELPMLYQAHKFDIRAFGLITQDMSLYVFSEAYIRLSSLPYSLDRMNYFIHLTNNAVQVKSGSYGSIVEGNIMGVSTFEQILNETPSPNPSNPTNTGGEEQPKPTQKSLIDELSSIKLEQGYLMQKITEQIKISFDCCKGLLNPNKREKCFELFGFDFMVDAEKRVWLIECNSVPSLGESNKFLTKFFNRLLDDMMKLTVDEIYPPPKEFEKHVTGDSPYNLDGFPNSRNLWNFVCKY